MLVLFFFSYHRFNFGEYIWNNSIGTAGQRWLCDNKSWFWDTVLLDCCTRTDFNTLQHSVLCHPSKQKASLVYFFFLKDMQLAYDTLILLLLWYFSLKFAPFLQVIKWFSFFHLKWTNQPTNNPNSLWTRNFHLYSQKEFLECSFSYSSSHLSHGTVIINLSARHAGGRDSFLPITVSPWLSREPGMQWVLHKTWRVVF